MSIDLHRLFDGLDDKSLDRLATRRDALRSGGRLASVVAWMSVPALLGATVKDAWAGTTLPDAVVKVLNFALTLEYLEATFYNRGLRSGVIPGGKDMEIFRTLQIHENGHVKFLLATLGDAAAPKPDFDFTAGGALPNPFKDYEVFKILAQGFEDTGVRAYKGQLKALKPYDVYLTAAATIHSVEARHASEIRRLRGQKGWIPFQDPGAPSAIRPTYAGEDQLVQLGVDVSQFQGTRVATESFDEPLTRAQVLEIAGPFIV